VSGIRRAVVGASGSPGSLRALRYAQELARAHNATLIPVLAWVPPGGDLADRRSPCGYLRRDGAEDAHQGLRDALTAPWGGIPADPPIQPLGERREAGWVLVSIASPGDLLVVGAGHRRALARVVCGKVSRYSLAHARCPVLAVPPARTPPGDEPWPARVGVLAPAADPRSDPSGPGQGGSIEAGQARP
jgi:nucleotide-binding universal stress UspA family protein